MNEGFCAIRHKSKKIRLEKNVDVKSKKIVWKPSDVEKLHTKIRNSFIRICSHWIYLLFPILSY